MTHPAPTEFVMPAELPDSFFTSLPGLPTLPHARENPERPRHANEIKAMVLYDLIIDDILQHQGCNITETAQRLGRKPSTISLIVRSDFFRARWLQRRAKFNEDLNFKLQSKMAQVVEKSLDTTLKILETKANIPLPDLNNLNASLLDRMGYGPSRPGGGPQVVVNTNAQAAAVSGGSPSVSPEALAKAKEHLRTLEAVNAASGHKPGNTLQGSRSDSASSAGASSAGVGPVVEGEAVRIREAEGGNGDSSST